MYEHDTDETQGGMPLNTNVPHEFKGGNAILGGPPDQVKKYTVVKRENGSIPKTLEEISADSGIPLNQIYAMNYADHFKDPTWKGLPGAIPVKEGDIIYLPINSSIGEPFIYPGYYKDTHITTIEENTTTLEGLVLRKKIIEGFRELLKKQQGIDLKDEEATIPKVKNLPADKPLAVTEDITNISRTLLKQYIGDQRLDGKTEKNPSNRLTNEPEINPTPDDIKLILQNFLSQDELSDEDKQLIASFVRKYLSDPDTQNEVFGYEDDKIKPSLYTEKMEDAEFVNNELESDESVSGKENRTKFSEEKQDINNKYAVHDIKTTEERDQKRSENRFVHKDFSRYKQLDDANRDLIENLKKQEAINQYNEERTIPENDDRRIPTTISGKENTADWFDHNVLVNMSPSEKLIDEKYLEADQEKSNEHFEHKRNTFEIEVAHVIGPASTEYDGVVKDQEEFRRSDQPQDQAEKLWDAYERIYLKHPGIKNPLEPNIITDKQTFINAYLANPANFNVDEIFTSAFGEDFNHNGKLIPSYDALDKIFHEASKALIEYGKDKSGFNKALDYFSKKFEPWITLGKAFTSLAVVSAESVSGNNMGMAFANFVAPNFSKTHNLQPHPYGKFTSQDSWTISGSGGTKGVLGLNERAKQLGLTPTLSYNAGLNYTQLLKNTDKSQLVEKIVYNVILHTDLLLSKEGNKPASDDAKVIYLLNNLNELSVTDLQDIVKDPSKFLTDFSKYDLGRAPGENIQSYRLELSMRRIKEKSQTFLFVQPQITTGEKNPGTNNTRTFFGNTTLFTMDKKFDVLGGKFVVDTEVKNQFDVENTNNWKMENEFKVSGTYTSPTQKFFLYRKANWEYHIGTELNYKGEMERTPTDFKHEDNFGFGVKGGLQFDMKSGRGFGIELWGKFNKDLNTIHFGPASGGFRLNYNF